MWGRMRKNACRLLLPLLLLPACAALAQSRGGLEIDIIGGNAAALPIAVVPFGGDCGQTDVGGVVRADLGRSGQFGRGAVRPARRRRGRAARYMRNTPKRVGAIGAFRLMRRLSASTSRLRRGSMIPSSQSRAEA